MAEQATDSLPGDGMVHQIQEPNFADMQSDEFLDRIPKKYHSQAKPVYNQFTIEEIKQLRILLAHFSHLQEPAPDPRFKEPL